MCLFYISVYTHIHTIYADVNIYFFILYNVYKDIYML